MSKGGKPGDVFDIQRMRQIIELMEQHDLREVDLQQGDEKIKLSRGAVAAPMAAAPPAVAPAAPAAAPAPAPAAGDSGEAEGIVTITAPMVGTFYARANPESEPYVKVGDQVSEDTVVCIVEAMKVFNEIPAECNGKIVEVLISDHEPVDFGRPMFRVQTKP